MHQIVESGRHTHGNSARTGVETDIFAGVRPDRACFAASTHEIVARGPCAGSVPHNFTRARPDPVLIALRGMLAHRLPCARNTTPSRFVRDICLRMRVALQTCHRACPWRMNTDIFP
jgi:hypothetical protein